MNINIFSIVWNAEEMLPNFLKHYSEFANRIFIVDDHSTDLTAKIATEHPLVTYVTYGHNGLQEDEFNDTFYRLYKDNPSDWAIVVDQDEFIYKWDTLKSEPSGVLKTKGYTMIGKTGKLGDCKPIRTKSFDKPVVFDPKLDVHFGDGRHTVNLPTRDSKLELWHYKYPSREYYLQHNTEGYPRYMDKEMMDYRLKRGLKWYDEHTQ